MKIFEYFDDFVVSSVSFHKCSMERFQTTFSQKCTLEFSPNFCVLSFMTCSVENLNYRSICGAVFSKYPSKSELIFLVSANFRVYFGDLFARFRAKKPTL